MLLAPAHLTNHAPKICNLFSPKCNHLLNAHPLFPVRPLPRCLTGVSVSLSALTLVSSVSRADLTSRSAGLTSCEAGVVVPDVHSLAASPVFRAASLISSMCVPGCRARKGSQDDVDGTGTGTPCELTHAHPYQQETVARSENQASSTNLWLRHRLRNGRDGARERDRGHTQLRPDARGGPGEHCPRASQAANHVNFEENDDLYNFIQVNMNTRACALQAIYSYVADGDGANSDEIARFRLVLRDAKLPRSRVRSGGGRWPTHNQGPFPPRLTSPRTWRLANKPVASVVSPDSQVDKHRSIFVAAFQVARGL